MLKKFYNLTRRKPASTSTNTAAPTDQTINSDNQKALDLKLVHSLNPKKIPSLKQLKYFPEVLDKKEKRNLNVLIGLIIASVVTILGTFYFSNFIPVPTSGGEYVEGLIGAPQYINPLLSQTNDVDADISHLIFSGLLKYDKNLQLTPDLADHWTMSEDKKTYTVVMRDNLTWQDGQPLTVEDLLFTYQSIKDPDFKSPLLVSFRGVEIEKVDSKTIKFTLPEPFPAFADVLTVGILPEHIWGEIPALNANLTEYNIKPIGSGAWQLKNLIKDKLGNIKSYTLVPNANYYGKKPYIQQLTFKFYPDFSSATEALKNNSIEGISFLPKELRHQLTEQRNLKYYAFNLPQYTAVFFNQKQNEVLKNKSIRQALAAGIDKEKILTEALDLNGDSIDAPLLPLDVTVSPDKKLHYDQALANKTLDDAGWAKITAAQYHDLLKAQAASSTPVIAVEATSTSTMVTSTEPTTEATDQPSADEQEFYRQKGQEILTITLTTVNQPESAKQAELVAQMWRTIGVNVTVQIVESSRISREIIKPRNYQVLLFGIIVGASADPYAFWHSSQISDPGLNLALLANRDVDKLLEDARSQTDVEKAKADYQKFADILATEIPAVFLHSPAYTYVADKKIKGLSIDRIIVPADRFIGIEDWYIKTKRLFRPHL